MYEMRNICIVGLGYVGLPLAIEFGKKRNIIGFDVNEKRIEELENGVDSNGEFSNEAISNATIEFTTNPQKISQSDFIIVAVPTPIDDAKNPDLSLIEKASETVGENLKPGSIVVYESTVYPGVTEEICVPILERISGLKCSVDFKIGYSPERINPGDVQHTLTSIVKVVSGIDKESLDAIAAVYSSIISAGVFKAKSIKVAEAAKVIENVQRDINIALVNELKMIFDKKNIDIDDVLEAAGTKWNFLTFQPGLVGGHCIGVDPYYLAYDATMIGHHPEMILAGRRINDSMAKYEVSKIVRKLIDNNLIVKGLKILILGATFKPNVKDLRNSKVKDLADELQKFGCEIKICEPQVSASMVLGYENVSVEKAFAEGFTVAVYAVKHTTFEENLLQIQSRFKLFLHLLK